MNKDGFEKLRIAILTFHTANNYGAVLQAYALQEYLSQEYGNTRILDYHNKDIDRSYAKPSIFALIHNPKKTVFKLFQSILFKGKNDRIDQFRKEYLKLTKRYEFDNIVQANEEADAFITGSDQVWNYMIIGKDTTFFLDFALKEKLTCSYAASIGVKEIPGTFVDLYRNALSHIKTISVRETAGVQTLEKIGIEDVEVMPDPTLLLSKERWEQFSVTPSIKGKYILVYKITTSDKMIYFAKELSRITKLPVIYIPNDLKSGIIGSLRIDVGPREWLGYIRNAEYVVTNSFHGTVFSILFGVKFFSEVSQKVNPSTSRILTLLSLFGFENRTIDCFAVEILDKELPISHVAEVCLKQQKRARQFFDKVLLGEG